MRALLFTVLVSFNLVACVTGDNAEDMDMPVGEITAAQQDDLVDHDVSDEDAQVRDADRETALPANAPAVQQNLEKRPVREVREVPETNGQLEQDGAMPKYISDTELETLSDEELMQLELEGRILPAKFRVQQIDENLPSMR